MREKMKINLLLATIFLSIIIYANINYQHGINGMTLRDGGTGCICHQNQSDSVIVWIEGPDSVAMNNTVQFRLLMTGGPAITGGFNIASYYGELNSLDTLTKILSGELTHTSPNPFTIDTVFWIFNYTAPDSIVVDTLYSVGNSTNDDGNPQPGDQWNFGENFIVTVIDMPVIVEKENMAPEGFALYQNYPNPFNPTTKIKFTILVTLSEVEGSPVTLKIYDALGNEVATLINEEKPAGEYELEFFASELSSGIYFYKLSVGSFNETKKMILMK